MPLSTGQINQPIFVVGSPRSGTSILTWCLGQHPNMLPLPESSWMGKFAIDVAISYEIGSARGDRSLLSAMDIQCEEFFASFGENINTLILKHRRDLARKRNRGSCSDTALTGAFTTPCSASEPKARWVDGTPEYSFHIYGLRKFFPGALFIHIVRDVTSVVRSMLNFHRLGGASLVANEQQAYEYWLRTVRCCLEAEGAYGPTIVHRLRYFDLINDSESAMRSALEFLGEPYTAACLKPLEKRINSSNVPPGFQTDDSATDPTLVAEARRLSADLEARAQFAAPSPEAAARIEAEFKERVQYVANVDCEYQKARKIIAALQQERIGTSSERSGAATGMILPNQVGRPGNAA